MTDGDKLPGLHLLRAVAAIVVFMLHATFLVFITEDRVESVGDTINLYFGLGVQLFYVVSAFALMHSTRVYEGAPDWVSRFYTKRFWRIAPLFYLMLLITPVFSYFAYDKVPSVLEFALNALFLNNFVPEWAGAIPFAGWSVGVEMLFYAIFPIAFIYVRTVRAALVLAIVAAVISQASRLWFDQIPMPFLGTYGDFAALTNAQYFAFGILAYLTYDRLKQSPFALSKSLGWSLATHAVFGVLTIGLGAFIVTHNDALRALHRVDMTLWGVVFALMSVWATVRPMGFYNWAPIQFLGERSYSIYLLHVLTINLIKPLMKTMCVALLPYLGAWALLPTIALAFLPVVAAATLSYAFIERPGMDFGKKLRKKAKAGDASQSTSGALSG